MFNIYEFEKRVKHEEGQVNQQLKDEKIHDNLRSKPL